MVTSIYYGETGWEGTVVECPQQTQVIPEEAATYETVPVVEAESPQDIVTESVTIEEKTEEVNPPVLQGSKFQWNYYKCNLLVIHRKRSVRATRSVSLRKPHRQSHPILRPVFRVFKRSGSFTSLFAGK